MWFAFTPPPHNSVGGKSLSTTLGRGQKLGSKMMAPRKMSPPVARVVQSALATPVSRVALSSPLYPLRSKHSSGCDRGFAIQRHDLFCQISFHVKLKCFYTETCRGVGTQKPTLKTMFFITSRPRVGARGAPPRGSGDSAGSSSRRRRGTTTATRRDRRCRRSPKVHDNGPGLKVGVNPVLTTVQPQPPPSCVFLRVDRHGSN